MAQGTGFKSITAGSVPACAFCPELEVIAVPSDPGHALQLRSATGEVPSGQRGILIKKPFAIGKYEVTFDEWAVCATDETAKKEDRCRDLGQQYNRVGDRRPVSGVSYEDIQTYLKWLSEKTKGMTKHRFRLPSEAEWEYAARAGSPFAWGPAQDEKSLCTFANGADASLKSLLWANIHCDDGKARGVTTVGSYRPNSLGLHDMLGNVWEWVADCYADPATPPADGTAYLPATCALRVAKGGSWRSGPESLTIASHRALPASERRLTVGFRVALDQD